MAYVNNIVVRTLMLEKRISQQSLLNIMEQEGLFSNAGRTSNYVTLNMALTGKRTSARYVDILQKAYSVLVRL